MNDKRMDLTVLFINHWKKHWGNSMPVLNFMLAKVSRMTDEELEAFVTTVIKIKA